MKSVSKGWRVAALGLAIVLITAACGGNKSNDSSSSSQNTSSSGKAGSLPATLKFGVPLDTSGSAAVAGDRKLDHRIEVEIHDLEPDLRVAPR